MFTMVPRGIRERGATGATRAGGRVHIAQEGRGRGQGQEKAGATGVIGQGQQKAGATGGRLESKVEKWTGATNVDRGRGKGLQKAVATSEKGTRQMDKRAGAIGRVDEQQGQLEEGGGDGHGKKVAGRGQDCKQRTKGGKTKQVEWTPD